MTYAPATLMGARSYLIGQGLPGASIGIVGDTAHGGQGYHSGLDDLLNAYGYGDYSVSESSRDGHPSNAAMALDVGGIGNLQEFSNWLVAQCRAGTADTQDIREVIYSPDGNVVRRWDRLGVRSSGDDSHLWHTHISYFRDSESRDKTGLFRRFFEGEDDMAFDDNDKASLAQVNAMLRMHHWMWAPTRSEYVGAGGDGVVYDAITQGKFVAQLNKAAANTTAAAPVIDYAQLAAALQPLVAKAVADELAKRLAS